MPNYTNLKDLFTATADAIRAKTGSTDPIVADNFPAAIESIQTGEDLDAVLTEQEELITTLQNTLKEKASAGGGGGADAEKDVRFYDYDGTLLHSYTVEEAQALTELPPLPEQPGLICQGWNWTLDGIKDMNRAVNVGAMYVTDDGKTRIYITLREGRTSPMLRCRVKGTVIVDWGDGTEPDELYNLAMNQAVTPVHNYTEPGDYLITLTPVENATIELSGEGNSAGGALILVPENYSTNSAYMYRGAIQKVEIGAGVTEFLTCVFSKCSNLSSITIPFGVSAMGSYCFYQCYNLSSVVIPSSINSNFNNTFRECFNAKIISIPDGITTIYQSAFGSCRSLESITIPNSVTSLGGGYAFENCSALKTVIIPNGVTSLGEKSFNYCSALNSITIPSSVTAIGQYTLQYCNSLTSLNISENVSTISNYMLSYCSSLRFVNIPEGVVSIGSRAFYSCYALVSVTVPSSVTSINDNAFAYCYSMKLYDFSTHTSVPTLANTNAFTNIPSDCEIRVPAALYDEWIAATNWATYASYIKAV